MNLDNNVITDTPFEFNILFDLSQELLCVISLDGIIQKVNNAFLKATGFSSPELASADFSSLIHPDDKTIFADKLNSLKQELQVNYTSKLILKDQSALVLHFSAVSDGENFIYLSASPVSSIDSSRSKSVPSADFTETDLQAQAEMNERRFKALLQGGSDLLGILSPEGNYMYVSPTVTHILGFDPSYYIGKNAFSFIHPEDVPKLMPLFESVIRNYKIEIPPYRFIDSNGKWHWLETVVTNLLHDPAVQGIVVNSKDITAKKESEEQTLKLNSRLDNVLENFTDGLFIISSKWKITFFNPAALHILGIPAERFKNARYLDIFPQAPELKFYSEYKRAFENNISVNFQEFDPVLNMWFDVTAYPYEDSLTVFFRDISKLKINQITLELEKEVLEMNASSRYSLSEITDHLIKGFEAIHYGIRCSLLLTNKAGTHLEPLSIPAMPLLFDAIRSGVKIDSNGCPSSQAAWNKKERFTADISRDEACKIHLEILKQYNILSCRAFPILDNSQEVLGTLSIFNSRPKGKDLDKSLANRLVTIVQLLIENYKSKENVQISNERYRLTNAVTNDTIWDWNLITNQLYRGDGFEKFFDQGAGFESSSLGKWESNLHPEDKDRVLSSLDAIVKNPEGYKWREEYRYKKSDGTYAAISDKGYVIRDENKNAIRMVGAMHDISERKQNLEKLKQSEENYKMLFSENPTPMWTYNMETNQFSMVNDAALHLYGYTREEFLALDLFSIRQPYEHERLRELLNSGSLIGNEKLSSEWHYLKKDGSVLIAESLSQTIIINGGKSRLVAVKDITDKKKAEQEILDQNRRLREIAFISSHEIRKPVASILGLVDLFEKDNPNSKFNEEIINHLDITTKELDQVIHSIVKKTWNENDMSSIE